MQCHALPCHATPCHSTPLHAVATGHELPLVSLALAHDHPVVGVDLSPGMIAMARHLVQAAEAGPDAVTQTNVTASSSASQHEQLDSVFSQTSLREAGTHVALPTGLDWLWQLCPQGSVPLGRVTAVVGDATSLEQYIGEMMQTMVVE